MSIVRNKKIERDLEKVAYGELLGEFKKASSLEGLNKFFDKFMTPSEKVLFVRRFTVMKLLERGNTYKEISELLEISSGTISNIRDIMAGRGYGKNPDRKRKYSVDKTIRKSKRFTRKYKGATNILDLI
jgi:uncharacterized protein YerC